MQVRPIRFGKRVRLSLGLALAAVILVGFAVWLMQAEGPGSDGVPRSVDDAREILSRLPGFSGLGEGSLQARALIAGIDIEKKEICPGEDVRIAVRTDATRLQQGFRHAATVQGIPAEEAVLRFGAEGKRSFFVAVTDGDRGIDFKTGTILVRPAKDPRCATKPRLVLYARPVQEETFRFEVIDAPNVIADRFRFDFGDGVVSETKAKTIEHSFLGRAQDKERSTFHVRVQALSGTEVVAEARHTVTFANTYFETTRAGSPQIPTEYSAYLPRSGAGAYETQVRFANPAETPIRLDQARLTLHPCDGSGLREISVPPRTILSDAELKPGAQSLRLRLAIPGGPLCAVQVHLEGDTVPPREGTRLPGTEGTISKTTTVLSFTMKKTGPKAAAALARAIEREKRMLLSGDVEPVPPGVEDKGRPKAADEEGPEPEAIER